MIIAGNNGHEGEVEEVRVLGQGLGALVTADFLILAMNLGRSFSAGTSVQIASGGHAYILGIAQDEPIYMATRGMIISTTATAGLDVDIELYEGVTCATNTANVVLLNNNRNSDREATFLINDDPATVTGGILLPSKSRRVVTAAKTYQITISALDPYAMRFNTLYAIKVTNNGDSIIDFDVTWNWMEVE